MRRLLVVVAAVSLSACFVPRDQDKNPADTRCVSCHGSADNPGDYLQRAAPPKDLRGNTETSWRGVGAHQLHLVAGATHGAIACGECHVVPERVDAPGHNDTGDEAEVVFGPRASPDGGATYDQRRASCTNYCHGAASNNVWMRPRTSDEACGSCHGLPPPLPHPQTETCHACHGDVVKSDRTFAAPELHVDGVVQKKDAACNSCHGSDDSGVPPRSLDGGTTRDNPGVGAHAQHLTTSANTRPVLCTECHVVPAQVSSPGHMNGGRAEVIFSGAALGRLDAGSYSTATLTCTAWCHSLSTDAGSPQWTRAGAPLGCDGCHASPPVAPHPQAQACAFCHSNVTADGGIVDRSLHVDGVVQASVPASCNGGCHGNATNAAPPRDLAGNMANGVPSVGAHQAHLVANGRSRPVPCAECHVVPATTFSPGHVDGVLDLRFSGVASGFGAVTTYANGRCTNYCHSVEAVLYPDAGRISPPWTSGDGGTLVCSTCHSMPPAGTHPARLDCPACHTNVNGSFQFSPPESHVNGVINF